MPSNLDLYTLNQNADLQKRVQIEILNTAQYIISHPELGPSPGNGTYTANNVAFAQQALSHPELFVPGFMGYVIKNATIQGDPTNEGPLAGVIAANLSIIWK